MFLFAYLGLAQVTTARLEGTISDETGAVIPGAKIAAIHNNTQVRSETTATAAGSYMFPSLPLGIYTISVEVPGFRKSVINDVELTVAATLNQRIKLEVGQVTESVSVQANAVRVETSDAQVSRAVTLRDIEALPSIGRGPMALAVFNPGVQADRRLGGSDRVAGGR